MTITVPKGFRAAGVTAGLKSSGAPDMALIVNDGPSFASASVFTSNRCKANPVLWSEQAASDGQARAVVINSGGANCYTGPAGFAATHHTAERVAAGLGIGPIDVIVCSTGLIGLLNDESLLLAGVDQLLGQLDGAGGDDAARAIMTTDTVPKTATVDGAGWSIGGIAKGAGMLAPALATMLVVITTDAALPADALDRALRAATAASFDRLDSDGCMSTNDTVTLMASGAADAEVDEVAFTEALTGLCLDLALQLLADAEGAEHEIHIETRGASTVTDALEVSRSVARSNLFKAAIFGNDPNWGRILASVGTTGATFDPHDLDVAINDIWVCRNSGPAADPASVDLKPRKVTVTIDLKSGTEAATIWTNDLTHAYVHENSAYSS